MNKKHKIYLAAFIALSIITFAILATVTVCAIFIKPKSPSWSFRRFVYFPIPKSVKDIKVDRHVDLLTHRYVFRFRIDEKDILKVIKSKPFEEFQQINYNAESGILGWGDKPETDLTKPALIVIGRGGFVLYSRHSREHAPEWFKLEEWKSPKVYVYEQQDVIRHRVLVYNKELGEAYFIDKRNPD